MEDCHLEWAWTLRNGPYMVGPVVQASVDDDLTGLSLFSGLTRNEISLVPELKAQLVTEKYIA